jgi:hypothetical protein
MKMNLDFLLLTPGFSRVKEAIPNCETVSTVWTWGRKPLKRFCLILRPDTRLKPGANESHISL